MRKFSLKKVLFGLATSLVLALAIGSFALGEAQTPVTPQVAEPTSVVAGAFTITGEDVTENTDYTFNGTSETDGLLTIISEKEMTIKTSGETNDRIKIDLPNGDPTTQANLTFDGVNINTDQGPAVEIRAKASFGVAITVVGENSLTSTARNFAGLQKNIEGAPNPYGTLTISGSGKLTVTGGEHGAGIGSGYNEDTANIDIINTTVEAYGRGNAAGIGGGADGNASEINITNSTVKAVGNDVSIDDDWSAAAGIGGSGSCNGSKITITNSIVTAIGGSGDSYYDDESDEYCELTAAAAIGGGGGFLKAGEWEANPGTGSENKIDSSSILIAKGGEDGDSYSIETLQGFDEGLKGLVFEQKTDSDASTGTMYGDVVLESDLTMPESATLTIPQNKSLTINEGKTLTVPAGSVLTNEGTLTIKGTLSCTDTGKVETLLNYDPQGGSIKTNDDNYITYQDASGVKEYENLPEATKEGYDLEGWYTKEKGQGTKVETTDDVLLNQHTLYANWVESEPPTPPTPTPPGPEPTPTPPEPTPDPSIDPDGGDGGSGASSKTSDPFMGGVALALLGVATTGAVLVRKRK